MQLDRFTPTQDKFPWLKWKTNCLLIVLSLFLFITPTTLFLAFSFFLSLSLTLFSSHLNHYHLPIFTSFSFQILQHTSYTSTIFLESNTRQQWFMSPNRRLEHPTKKSGRTSVVGSVSMVLSVRLYSWPYATPVDTARCSFSSYSLTYLDRKGSTNTNISIKYFKVVLQPFLFFFLPNVFCISL